jgi:hypothetical protein
MFFSQVNKSESPFLVEISVNFWRHQNRLIRPVRGAHGLAAGVVRDSEHGRLVLPSF